MLRLVVAVLAVLMGLAGCVPNDTFQLPPLAASCSIAPAPGVVRFASYNIKSGRETTLQEVGDAIAQISPDVIALQEVDVGQKRTGEVDQVQALADRFGYQRVYAATLSRGVGTYGIAMLSRLPILSVQRINLRAPWAAEPRVAIDATVCMGETKVRVISTHADVWNPAPNIDQIVGQLEETVSTPTIVMGDLNVKPNEIFTQGLVSHGLVDLIGKFAEGPTFWFEPKRLDYLFVDPWLQARAIGAAIGTSRASDHHPIWADFDFANPTVVTTQP